MRAGGSQLGCQSATGVNRAAEDDPQRSARRDHRLPPRIAAVEDGDAPMTEHDTGPALDTLAVRPSPGQRVDHVLDPLQRQGRVLDADYAGNAAHGSPDGFVRVSPNG